MARKTRKQMEADAAAYVETTNTVLVALSELRPGWVILRPSGARYEIVTVDEDRNGTFADRLAAWTSRGLSTAGARCFTWKRIDTWGFPEAMYERDEVLVIAQPDTADISRKVEVSSL